MLPIIDVEVLSFENKDNKNVSIMINSTPFDTYIAKLKENGYNVEEAVKSNETDTLEYLAYNDAGDKIELRGRNGSLTDIIYSSADNIS